MKSTTRKIRKVSVALAEPNIEWGQFKAEQMGVSFSEIVRRALVAAQEKDERTAKRK